MASLMETQGMYYAQFYGSDRSPRRKTVPLKTRTKRSAQRALIKLEDLYSEGEYDPWTEDNPLTSGPEVTTIGEAVEEFQDSRRHLAESTQKKSREILRPFLRHVGESTPPPVIDSQLVTDYLESTDTKLVTKETYCRHFRTLWGWMEREGYVKANVIEDVQLGQIPDPDPATIDEDELQSILEAIEEHSRSNDWLAPLVEVAFWTGLRRGELTNLRWKHVDLEDEVVHVKHDMDWSPKGRQDRTVPLMPPALSVLEERYEGQGGEEPVFQHSNGQIDPNYCTQTFKRYARHAGLEEVSFHDLRHSFCSLLARRGASAEVIKRAAGHSSLSVTERYMHLDNDDVDQAMREAFGG